MDHTHTYLETVTDPTCTEPGFTTHTCLCGESYVDTYTDALGHSWDDGTVTLDPTETTEGEQTFTCTCCGDSRIETIPMTECPSAVFTDMPVYGNWAHDPIDWAVSNGITNGTTPTTFGPKKECTSAQIVTFLWRAKENPAPESAADPFVDIKPGASYYDAVLWAVENGITDGVDATHFAPSNSCTRAHAVTFLWRAFR